MLLTLLSLAVEVPQADPRLVELDLVAPRNDLIDGESLQYEVVLRNLGPDPVPIAVPYEHFGLRMLSGCQLFLRPFYKGSGSNPFSQARPFQMFSRNLPIKVEEAPWPPTDFFEGGPPSSVVWLPPGQKISWSEVYISEGRFGVLVSPDLIAVKAQWLLGPEKWIESRNLDLVVHDLDIQAGEVVFEEKLRPPVSQSGIVAKLTKMPIGNKSFLFYTGGSPIRLCEVGAQEKVEAFVDENASQLVVSFPESTRPPVYVQLVWGGVSTSPWPVIPPDGMMPEPRPELMSKEEISAARKRLGLAFDGSDQPAQKGTAPEMGAENFPDVDGQARPDAGSGEAREIDSGRNTLLWALSVAIVVAFVVLVLRSRKRRLRS